VRGVRDDGAWLGVWPPRGIDAAAQASAADVYAPLSARAGAFLVDIFIVVVMSLGIMRFYYPQIAYAEIFSGARHSAASGAGVFHDLLHRIRMVFQRHAWKFLMGLRVVMDGGKPLTLWAALVRNAMGVLERHFVMLIVTVPC